VNRAILGAAGAIASLAVVACGSATSGSGSTASPSPSAGARRGHAGNVAFGQLVQITGPTLILSNTNGDSTVTYAATTTITQTATGTVADITAGSCINATGTKDAAGTLTAASVTLSAPTKGSCTTPGFGGGGGGGGGGAFSPRPSFSPPAGAAGFTAARGQVKTVSGTSVTLTEASGTATINVPTTVKVTMSTVVTATALQTGQCLTAIGTKASSGAVAARVLTISPAGANGCTAGFGGGRGGFGGGGFGGGGFGGGGGSSGA
jgi:hypothetical protein